MSNSLRPHRRQPTRLPRPWDSPDKNTGVGCHFLLQCLKVKSESEVAQSCPTLSDPWTAAYQAPLSIFQARVLEWVAIAFSISWINSFNSSCPLQYCCLENPMDRRDWWAPIHRAAKSWTQLVTEPTALQCW